MNGVEHKDARSIEREVFTLYSGLYSTDYASENENILNNYAPYVEDFRIEELDAVILKMAVNTSSGTDGLTV